MKYLWLALFCCLISVCEASVPDSIGISPALLRRSFNSPTDSDDYFLAGTVQTASMTIGERSFYMLDADTVLRPEHEDELAVSYASIEDAKTAYARLYRAALDRTSGIYQAFVTGAFVGRSGSWIIVRWMRQDISRFDLFPARRYFRSDVFNNSFEILRGTKMLK